MSPAPTTVFDYYLPFILYQVITKLEGHKGRVTGLAFSTALNVLVSSGRDAQVSICIILYEETSSHELGKSIL